MKWHRVRPEAARRVSARLDEVRALSPRAVPPLCSHGLAAGSRADWLRIESRRVQGRPLHVLCGEGELERREGRELARLISAAFEEWRRIGFVHGDLSPRNVLVGRGTADHGSRLTVWFIDWIIDLESFEGTPDFAAPEVRLGRHSHDSDCYAMDRILCILAP